MLWAEQYNHSTVVLTKKNSLINSVLLSTSCKLAIFFGFSGQFLLTTCSRLFFYFNIAVHRRTGGLENMANRLARLMVVHRRTGGLEIPRARSTVSRLVHRRTGGLENYGIPPV